MTASGFVNFWNWDNTKSCVTVLCKLRYTSSIWFLALCTLVSSFLHKFFNGNSCCYHFGNSICTESMIGTLVPILETQTLGKTLNLAHNIVLPKIVQSLTISGWTKPYVFAILLGPLLSLRRSGNCDVPPLCVRMALFVKELKNLDWIERVIWIAGDFKDTFFFCGSKRIV
jgi:hypothetical protein